MDFIIAIDLYDRLSQSKQAQDPTHSIEMAIWDLDDYLTLFPDRSQAREVRHRLSVSV